MVRLLHVLISVLSLVGALIVVSQLEWAWRGVLVGAWLGQALFSAWLAVRTPSRPPPEPYEVRLRRGLAWPRRRSQRSLLSRYFRS